MTVRQQLRMATIIAVAFCFNFPAYADSYTAKVVGVSDGDTIKVFHDGIVTKVRLANVDCPEHNQDFGQKAKQFTSDYVFNKNVVIDGKSIDRYHRTIGEVSPLDKTVDFSHALVANGLAWVYRQYCRDASFYPLENAPRMQHAGLWSQPNPEPPWEFRKHEKGARQLAHLHP